MSVRLSGVRKSFGGSEPAAPEEGSLESENAGVFPRLGPDLVRHRRVFLLHEPLSNLDLKMREFMRMELKKLHRALRITTIFVTHDQSEAMSLSDRIAVMRLGRVEQVGRPQEFYDSPAN